MKPVFKPMVAMLLIILFAAPLMAEDNAVVVRTQEMVNPMDILAEFDGGEITRGELMDKINQLQPQQQGRFKTTEGQLQVLDIMAAEELFYKKALEMGVPDQEDVRTKINNAQKQFYISEYYRRNVTDLVVITDQMREEFYNQNLAFYFVHPFITIEYIQAESEAAANQALQMLASGASWASVSDSLNINSYAKGLQGRLRNIRLNGNIPGVGNDPELESLIDAAELGMDKIVGPQKTVTGWSIFRKVEMVPGSQRSFDEVKDEIDQRLRPKVERDHMNSVLDHLKTKYEVRIDSLALQQLDLRNLDENVPFSQDTVIYSTNDEISMTVNDLLEAFSRVSPQEQIFYVRGEGSSQFVDQELSKNLMYAEAKAQGMNRYFEDNPEYKQMKRYHILTKAFRTLVRDAVVITTEDARAYYEENLEAYTTPASRDIQILWFDDMDVANRTWSLFNMALRTRNEAKMRELIERYSTQPERSILENQYNNGTVTGVGPDSQFSSLIWSTEPNQLSPVFTTAQGSIVFFRVMTENPESYTPFTEVEPRIQGALKQQKEREKQDEVIQNLTVQYNLRKYPERITLLLSAEDLFELANSAAQQRNYRDAITYYDQIIANYKNNADDYKATFMKAFLISEEMDDKPRALEIFKSFLQDFPEGDLTESAQFMVDVIEGRVDPNFQVDEN